MTVCLQGSDVLGAEIPIQCLNMGVPMHLCIATPKPFNDGHPSKSSNKETVAVAGSASAI